jgi:serine/threonine protein kinase
MGIVFEAEDLHLQRRIALKAIRPALAASNSARQRFLREAQRMAALTHDHILVIHHVGEDRGILFLAMPLLHGESLDARLHREGQLPVAEALRIGRETALGLAAAHERGVIHRDVKPANLWLEAPSGRVKILDFGLARLAEGDTSVTGSLDIIGTPTYMAPEQAEGEADPRADLFSLGCVLYRLVTGQLAFPGKTLAAVLRAVAMLDPSPPRQINPHVPEQMSQLIERLLSKDRTNRPASAAAVVRELEEIERVVAASEPAGAAESPAHQASGDRPVRKWSSSHPVASAWSDTLGASPPVRRRRWLWLSSAGLVLAGVVAVGILVPWLRPSTRTSITPIPGKLAILNLDVDHYLIVNGHSAPRQRLGEGSIVTFLNDFVSVETRLSQPAFAFLIAFRADGKEELCFPDKPDKVPPKTDHFRFPPASTGMDYQLEDGTGLQAFAVVASSQPLPSFQEWWSRQGCPWQKSEAPPDVVWRTLDGLEVEALTADPSDKRGTKEVRGKTPVMKLATWLKQRPRVEAAAVLGFAVMPKGGQ